MKKLLITLLSICSLALCGCDNGNQGSSGGKTYNHVHVQIGDKVMHDDIISYAYDWDGTIVEVNTKTYGWIMVSNNFMLYSSDRCPLCNNSK